MSVIAVDEIVLKYFVYFNVWARFDTLLMRSHV